MKKTFVLFFLALLIGSCSDDQLVLIDIPSDIELDLNEDGSTDFRIVYKRQLEGDPVGNFEAVRLNMESLGANQVLKSEDEPTLFIDDTDVIKSEVTSPLFWEITNPSASRSTLIAKIRTDYDETEWNESWTIFSLQDKETYLMGVKILEANATQIGFVEFSVDASTGQFTLINKELF